MMTEEEFKALQQWRSHDLLEGVRYLMAVTPVNSLTDLFRLNEIAERYRQHYILHTDD
ncbi:hypothetical protein [Oceanospirillum sanctuarii]|uniref:hypothetical protein n=1 Tax=Oceanospirillum sanctuarii TaxID=1434821 RepID=UPI001594D79C|nr:hypothetical protein [Oceanospirillum sanctuarii]